MIPRVTGVRHLHDYVLELTFDDGLQAEIDFRDRVVGRGGVFEPLEDIAYFKRVAIEPDSRTIAWPNEVDFCPQTLHEWASAHASADREE